MAPGIAPTPPNKAPMPAPISAPNVPPPIEPPILPTCRETSNPLLLALVIASPALYKSYARPIYPNPLSPFVRLFAPTLVFNALLAPCPPLKAFIYSFAIGRLWSKYALNGCGVIFLNPSFNTALYNL